MSIIIREVSKRFGSFVALDNVSLEVPTGSLIALVGPSGSGKTTLLRILAGLETADSGSVLDHEEEVTHRPPQKRNVGFVFQHYALFRHMSVFENVAFPLRVRRRANAEVKARVGELLHLVRLEGLGDRYPSQLSGGQRQRVALARALAAEPRVLLLDEPFGALDARVRQELRQWLRRLHDELHVTSLFVTHDQEEAFAVADRVVILNRGRIEQQGTPAEVFEKPANAFVIDFLGNVNVLDPRDFPHAGDRSTVYVRPHDLDVEHAASGAAGLAALVVHVHPAGSVARVQMESLESRAALQVEISLSRLAELRLVPGQLVRLTPRKVHTFEPEYAI